MKAAIVVGREKNGKGILFRHKKEGNPAMCDNMDGPHLHNGK